MLFFYIRHGDPVYEPDSLTALGEKQSHALAKRLALYGIDRVFASSSNRAILTAKPTCDMLNKEVEILDFANEGYACREFVVERDGMRAWAFHDLETKSIFASEEVLRLGHKWYEHKELKSFKPGAERIREETYKFFKSLGYEHIKDLGKYKVLKPNDERVAFFAHQGFGLAFLAEVLDIPYPLFANHFNICHSGMTVIDFKEENGYAIPKTLTLSSDSHIYREGLPTKYNHLFYF